MFNDVVSAFYGLNVGEYVEVSGTHTVAGKGRGGRCCCTVCDNHSCVWLKHFLHTPFLLFCFETPKTTTVPPFSNLPRIRNASLLWARAHTRAIEQKGSNCCVKALWV